MDNHTFEIASQFMLLEEEEFYQMTGSLDSGGVSGAPNSARVKRTPNCARTRKHSERRARVSGIGMSTSIRVYCSYVCPYDNESR